MTAPATRFNLTGERLRAHGIVQQLPIGTDQGQRLALSLRHKHAVKRVAMVHRQVGSSFGVRRGNAQHGEAVRLDLLDQSIGKAQLA